MKVNSVQEAMQLAIDEARVTMKEGLGGPFGAAVVNMTTGKVVAVASNTVLGDHDPTAHAEVNAIRKACKVLGKHDLSGHYIVATSHPCPMCLGALMWSNLDRIYYGATPDDADAIGFKDAFIYQFIKGYNWELGTLSLNIHELDREKCKELFDEYVNLNGEMY